ncbi:MAG: DegT/DnrJ/EryC1/StrS family aminotransferase [Rhodospirillaceae bacterium]|nr:DegT/DnrJ/EryC1/StrS family aminotransferase [Rhodospirillaceae bacterium]MDD9928653.1 DegT/DnrJ/EryC1/StrS family aminotransferase [Rhodospirillaceae bacterium]
MAFVDLKAQYQAHKAQIDGAIQQVLDHGRFIMGPEVAELETALCQFAGAKYAIGCSSGTDALVLTMMAEDIGPGDAVFVPAFTFTATAEVPLLLGATPVFVDVDPDDFNIDCDDLERRIEAVVAAGELTPRAVLAVDLFGLPVDYDRLHAVAERHGLKIWGDAAQSFGGAMGERKVGTLCRATATSFFPAKPLGCYGDGGAVLTDDDALAERMQSIRAHGKGGAKYDIVRVGLNARLDTIQAAVLLAKLPNFPGELERRETVARRYDELLSDVVKIPSRYQGRVSAWAQYTVKLPADRRDEVAANLRERGIPTAIYYPMPMHMQTAYRAYGDGEGSVPVSERLSGEVLSLPMHPYMEDADVVRVAEALTRAVS